MQASGAKRRPAAEAALQSIVHLCRWACEPLQGRYPTKQIADAQGRSAFELLCKAASSGGGMGGGESLCAAAVAAAGPRQLQHSAAALADLLPASAVRLRTVGMALQLATVTRLLLCMCGCPAPSSSDAQAPGGGSNAGGGTTSLPVTVACLHSRPGRRLLNTRVDAPAQLLAAVFVMFDEERSTTFSRMLQSEVRGRLCRFATKRCRCCVCWLGVASRWAKVAPVHYVAAPGEVRQQQGGCLSAPMPSIDTVSLIGARRHMRCPPVTGNPC